MPGRAQARGRGLAAALTLALLLGAGALPHAAGEFVEVAGDLGVAVQTAGEVHPDDPADELWPAFPEIMGPGVCWADLNGDGHDDLYVVNHRYNPENPAAQGWSEDLDPTNRLFLNDGHGGFVDHTEASGTGSRAYGYGCSAADYDGDGDVDLYVTNFADERFGPNELFRNRGNGTFDEAGAEAGVDMPGGCGESPCWSTTSSWADYDRDGDLDLYVGTFVESSLTDHTRGPTHHAAQANWLFRNHGDGTFTDVAWDAQVSGIPSNNNGAKTLGVVWFDHDLDGWPDLYICNDSVPNYLFVNLGDGLFEERSAVAGVDDGRASMGCASGDYDGDGLPDLFMTHYEGQTDGFYRNLGDGTFEDRSGEDGLAGNGPWVGWGTAFLDYDRDGDLDLFAVNGHTEWDDDTYGQPSKMFRQDPPLAGADPWDAVWVDASRNLGEALEEARVSRGMGMADFDRDGDTDLVVTNNNNETLQFLRADLPARNWLTLQLRQPGMNPSGIGARVALEAGGKVQWRELQAGGSFLSQHTLDLEFGLGTATEADRITVHWPDGGTSVVEDVAAKQVVRLDRATSALVNDTLAPRSRLSLSGPEGVDGWWGGPVEARVATEDLGVTWASGVAGSAYALDGAAWTAWPADPDGGPGALAITGEGRHELRVRSRDAAGNLEPWRTTFVGVDETPPVVEGLAVDGEAGLEGWWVSEAVTVTVEARDALSGVHRVRYRVDQGPWNAATDPFEVRGDGVHVVEAFAVDRVGNEAPVEAFEVRIDSTAPEVAVARPVEGGVYLGDEEQARLPGGPAVVVAAPAAGGEAASRLTVVALAGDEVSGVDRVVFRVDGKVAHVDRAAPFSWGWPVEAASPGPHEVEALALDVAGNLAGHAVPVAVAPVALPEAPADRPGDAPGSPPATPARGQDPARRS